MGCMGHCYLGHSVTCVTFHAQSEYLGIRMLDSKMCMGVASARLSVNACVDRLNIV